MCISRSHNVKDQPEPHMAWRGRRADRLLTGEGAGASLGSTSCVPIRRPPDPCLADYEPAGRTSVGFVAHAGCGYVATHPLRLQPLARSPSPVPVCSRTFLEGTPMPGLDRRDEQALGRMKEHPGTS